MIAPCATADASIPVSFSRYDPLRNMTYGSPLSRNIFFGCLMFGSEAQPRGVGSQDARVSDGRHAGPRCDLDDVLMVRSALKVARIPKKTTGMNLRLA
jgi:hypothetical protein